MKGDVLAGRSVSKGLENILAELRRAGFEASKRGGHGGYWLARPAADITVADVIRTLDGAAGCRAGRPVGRPGYGVGIDLAGHDGRGRGHHPGYGGRRA